MKSHDKKSLCITLQIRPDLGGKADSPRWNHFETIHTIGWCVVFNGIIQGALSRKEQWRNVPVMIRNYALIAIAIVALTIPVWIGVGILVPGYPWARSAASADR